jgi:hypothetical protein
LVGSFVSVAAALGCSQLPSYDGRAIAADPNAPPPPATHGPRQLTPVDVVAVALAADASGIYWTSPTNKLWVLPAQVPLPVPLAADSGVAVPCTGPTAPLLSSSHVFWMGSDRATLHRTPKDGTADERLAAVNDGDHLAGDGSAVYWTESARIPDGDDSIDGSAIRSLPRDATSGSPPTTLLLSFDAISSLAVADGTAYWTPFPNATVYDANIWSSTVAALAGGASGTELGGLRSPYDLTSFGGQIYFAYYPDLWTTALGRLAADGGEQSIGVLPDGDGDVSLALADGWLLASAASGADGCGGNPSQRLWATPLAGGAPKLIAQGLRTAAIAAPQGIVFVDASQHLVALPTTELAATISPVP